jgi:hypothetical protein
MSTKLLYKCEICGYKTSIKCNIIRHQNRKNPCKSATKVTIDTQNVSLGATNVSLGATNVSLGATNVSLDATNVSLDATNVSLDTQNLNHDAQNVTVDCYKCTKCHGIFKKKYNLDKHLKICNGVNNLTCHICLKTFKHRNSKYKHLKNVICTPPVQPEQQQPTTVNNTSITNNNDNSHSHNKNTNSYNTNCNNVTILAFGNENYSHLIDNHELMKKFINDREYGLIDCLKLIHYNDEVPENQNIKKNNRKDDFVDVYDGSTWKLRMVDFACTKILNSLEKLFTDYIDDFIENNNSGTMLRNIKVFCNKVCSSLDWEFNNVNREREVSDDEMKEIQQKVSSMIAETLYRETIACRESELNKNS